MVVWIALIRDFSSSFSLYMLGVKLKTTSLPFANKQVSTFVHIRLGTMIVLFTHSIKIHGREGSDVKSSLFTDLNVHPKKEAGALRIDSFGS